MVEYLKTKKGYFYKLLKNGEKKRISREEYNKKIRQEKNKTRKNKKMIGGGKKEGNETTEPILQSDIKYQDDFVCILKPDVKKGIIVWTNFVNPSEADSLCNLGIKTGKQLQHEGSIVGVGVGSIVPRGRIHPYSFFRAPYYSRDIDYTSVETEVNSSYGEGQIGMKQRAFIRVDPDQTVVFSSEIRADIPGVNFHIDSGDLISFRQNYNSPPTHSRFYMPRTDERYSELYNEYYNSELNKSRKLLSTYLHIIKVNQEIKRWVKSDKKLMYNLFTSQAVEVPIMHKPTYPFNNWPIERNSEILVSNPHLTEDHFVLCNH